MEDYLEKIREFYGRHNHMPSYQTMCDLFGFSSKNAVSRVVSKLVEAGHLTKDSSGRLVPKCLVGEIPLLGVVEAGFPSPAEEDTLDSLSLDDYLIENREASFLLTVKGDSMKDAGIKPGDMVVVERTNAPRLGDIVIAHIDGQWTMKYYRKRGESVYLQAANTAYPDLFPKESLHIEAVVKGVVRKY